MLFCSFHSSETITWSRAKISHALKNFWRRLIVARICFWRNCTCSIYDILTICWVQTFFESIRLVAHNWQSSDPLFHCLKVFVILLLLVIIFLLRNFSFTWWFHSSWIFTAGWRWSFHKSSLQILWVFAAPWIFSESLILKIHRWRSNWLRYRSSVASTSFSLA